MFAEELRNHEDTPAGDQIVVLHGLGWSDYQRMLEVRGDASVPRFAYLEGQLEIMAPCKSHELLKSRLGHLLAVWCLEKGIEFSSYGSWTLEKKAAKVGIDPDECYVFGIEPEAERPHLAIEVIWTAGGIRKLEIYRQFGVREVWFWRRGRLCVHCLNGEQYLEAQASGILAGIDLGELCGYLDHSTSQASREYRAALNQRQASR